MTTPPTPSAPSAPSAPSPARAPARARTAPGPRGLPLLGILPELRRSGDLSLLGRMQRDYGDVVRYRLGPFLTHLVSHPDGVRHVLQDHVKNYTKDHFSYRMLKPIGGNGLLLSQGSFWLRQRRLAQPAFHRQRIAAMGAQMVAAAGRTLQRFEEASAQGRPVRMLEEMSQLTLEVVGEALLGASVGEKAQVVARSFHTLSEQVTARFRSLNLLPPVLPTRGDRAFRAARGALLGTVDALVAERRREGAGDRGDLLSMFMLAVDEETGEQMNDAQLRDEVVTMLVAGHETTATTLSWVWGLLEQNPGAEARLHAELAQVLGGRAPTVEDVPRLAYTRQVVEEAMRLYPPVYVFSRAVAEEDVIGGFRIPRGSAVDISAYVTHRRPDLWERPEAFLPERFAPEAAASRPRYAYFPFSGGPRQCIGNGFAMLEAQLLLATLAQRFRPRLAPGHALLPEALITLRPAGGLPMHVERRG